MEFQNYQAEDFLTDESFLNYCSGNNAADIRFWENWLLKNPEKRSVVAEAQSLYSQLVDELGLKRQSEQHLEEFKSLFSAQIRSPVSAQQPTTTARSRFFISKTARVLAAASIILILTFVFFYKRNDIPQNDPVVQIRYIPQDSIRKTTTLPDGSLITLNPNSRIELSKDFNKKFRIVTLIGEAFFEVVKDSTKPFIVNTGDVSTTAVGTSFMVRYYQHEDQVKVSLLSGKVKVERLNAAANTKSAVYLTPGLEVVIDKKLAPAVLKKKAFEFGHLEEWKLNFLTFNDAEFSEIVNKLEEWYGVKVEVNNAPTVTKHFTGEFKDQNLHTVMEALSFAHKFQYQIKPDRVIIQF